MALPNSPPVSQGAPLPCRRRRTRCTAWPTKAVLRSWRACYEARPGRTKPAHATLTAARLCTLLASAATLRQHRYPTSRCMNRCCMYSECWSRVGALFLTDRYAINFLMLGTDFPHPLTAKLTHRPACLGPWTLLYCECRSCCNLGQRCVRRRTTQTSIRGPTLIFAIDVLPAGAAECRGGGWGGGRPRHDRAAPGVCGRPHRFACLAAGKRGERQRPGKQRRNAKHSKLKCCEPYRMSDRGTFLVAHCYMLARGPPSCLHSASL